MTEEKELALDRLIYTWHKLLDPGSELHDATAEYLEYANIPIAEPFYFKVGKVYRVAHVSTGVKFSLFATDDYLIDVSGGRFPYDTADEYIANNYWTRPEEVIS